MSAAGEPRGKWVPGVSYRCEFCARHSRIVQTAGRRFAQCAFSRRSPDAFKRCVEEFLLESASYFDVSAESFYHGLVLGMLSFMRDIYAITSNRLGRRVIPPVFPRVAPFPRKGV